MKGNFLKMAWLALLPLALLLLGARPASADPVFVFGNQVVSLSQLTIAQDIVLCDPGTVTCNAMTPNADIEGVGVFYNSAAGPFTPDEGIDANTVTFLIGGQLNFFLTNFPGGFSPNAVFLDASANGMTAFGNFVFVDQPAPSATPEPATWTLLGIGVLGLWGFRHRFTTA